MNDGNRLKRIIQIRFSYLCRKTKHKNQAISKKGKYLQNKILRIINNSPNLLKKYGA